MSEHRLWDANIHAWLLHKACEVGITEKIVDLAINLNKSVESTNHEIGLPDATSLEVSIENTDEGSKAEVFMVRYFMIPVKYCDFCRKAGLDIKTISSKLD